MDDNMISYCGLDCSKCEIFLASQINDEEKLLEFAEKWFLEFKADVNPEDVLCDGCKSGGRLSFHCKQKCEIRELLNQANIQ